MHFISYHYICSLNFLVLFAKKSNLMYYVLFRQTFCAVRNYSINHFASRCYYHRHQFSSWRGCNAKLRPLQNPFKVRSLVSNVCIFRLLAMPSLRSFCLKLVHVNICHTIIISIKYRFLIAFPPFFSYVPIVRHRWKWIP